MTLSNRASTLSLLVLLSFFTGPGLATRCSPGIPCSLPIDVVLVLDESGSIEPTSFNHLKTFASNFAGLFTISPSQAHVGIVMFSDLSRTVLNLNSPGASDPGVVQTSISSISQVAGGTNTQAGISTARSMLTVARSARTVSRQIMVIVTDGNANLPGSVANAQQTALNQANTAKTEGVLVLGVAVGSSINQGFIAALSSGPEYKFSVGDFSDLQSIVHDLIDQSCYQPPSLSISDEAISCDDSTSPLNTGVPTVTGWCRGCAPSAPTYTDAVTPGSCPQAETIQRTWSTSDECGGVTTVVQEITVTDHEVPTFISFPPNAVVECLRDTSTTALGEATATDNCDPNPVVTHADTQTPGSCPNEFSIARRFKAQDACGNKAVRLQSINVRDSTPPTITQVNNFCVWPPNHKRYCIKNVTFSDLVYAEDACSGETFIQYLGCTSSQADNDLADGNTTGDCTYDSLTDTLCLRSERAGNIKEDRVYTVHLAIEDYLDPNCANLVQTTLKVSVPHDQRNHPECKAPNSSQ